MICMGFLSKWYNWGLMVGLDDPEGLFQPGQFYDSITEILKWEWGRIKNLKLYLQGEFCVSQILYVVYVLCKYCDQIYRQISNWRVNEILMNIWTLLYHNYRKYYTSYSLCINLISLYPTTFLTVTEFYRVCFNAFSYWKEINKHFKYL